MQVLLSAIKEAHMYCHPLDPSRPETEAERRQAPYRRWAEDELLRHDRAIDRRWRQLWATLSEAMAETGCEDQRKCAADHLHDLMQDVFGAERARLLSALDNEGGDVTRHPCPITRLHKEVTA